MSTQKPFVFLIFDGWGHNPSPEHNAIAAAATPHWDQLTQDNPQRLLSGSGLDVGLPEGQMGNSEVGHMHMGAGRVIYQDLTRIHAAIESGEFQQNKVLLQAIQDSKKTGKNLHVLGLVSPGGVHSHESHLHALIKMAAAEQCGHVFIHVFLDGRDCPPKSATDSITALEALCQQHPTVKIASVTGRFYAMDRDQRWGRTQAAYDCLVNGDSETIASSATAALQAAYALGDTDEFVKPTIIQPNYQSINDGDSIIFMNFRADRARQLSRALIDKNFTGFTRARQPALSHFVSLTQYASDIASEIAFPAQSLNNVLGDVIAQHQLKQVRVAETEKYAHVTFFFNGGREQPFQNEARVLIPSPKEVATYDLKPEMSAAKVADAIVQQIEQQDCDVIIANFANPDMVGHTGNFAATVTAIESVDQALGRIMTALKAYGGELMVTADHGNAESMYDPDSQQAHTAHTSNPIPLVYMGRKASFDDKPASLADLAPTILARLQLPIPTEMTGRNLLADD